MRTPPPGLKHRQQEHDMLKEAALGGSAQARMRLPAAERALARQKRVAAVRNRIGRPRAY